MDPRELGRLVEHDVVAHRLHGNMEDRSHQRDPYLVMRDERGPLRFQLQEATDGGVLLNGRPYSLMRI